MAGTILKVRTTSGDVAVDYTGLANKPDTDTRLTTLEGQMADLMYEAIQINSFSHNLGTCVRGQTITSVTLSWSTNKTPTALTLDGVTLDVESASTALSGLSITWDNIPTWTLKATDERDTTVTKTCSVSFGNYICYGASAAPGSINADFVFGLTKVVVPGSTLSARTFTANAGEGEYIYFCCPARFGARTFKVGGFEGGFTLVSTLTLDNGYGYSESYYIYRSDNPNLGSVSVTVS